MLDCVTRGLLIALALAVAAVRTGKQAHPCMFIRLSLSCGNQKISHRHQKDVGMTLADTAHPPVLRDNWVSAPTANVSNHSTQANTFW